VSLTSWVKKMIQPLWVVAFSTARSMAEGRQARCSSPIAFSCARSMRPALTPQWMPLEGDAGHRPVEPASDQLHGQVARDDVVEALR
jgi:hypothetical protein